MKKEYVYDDTSPACRFNPGVGCYNPTKERCKHCGWNPSVTEKRLEKIKQKEK